MSSLSCVAWVFGYILMYICSTCKLKIEKISLSINLLISDVDIKDVQDELKKQGVRYL